MKRLFPLLTAVAALTVPHMVTAQTAAPAGNNPTGPGIYVEGMLGANFASDIEFEFNDGSSLDADPDTGLLGGLAVGYNIPLDQLSFRVEGEFTGRANAVDELEVSTGGALGLEDADISSIAGMINGHLDFYLAPNLALAAGVGLGYANVKLDLVAFDDDVSGFAYQLRLGSRYHFSPNTALSLGYTYFATTELEVDANTGDEAEFDYANHGVYLGLAYLF